MTWLYGVGSGCKTPPAAFANFCKNSVGTVSESTVTFAFDKGTADVGETKHTATAADNKASLCILRFLRVLVCAQCEDVHVKTTGAEHLHNQQSAVSTRKQTMRRSLCIGPGRGTQRRATEPVSPNRRSHRVVPITQEHSSHTLSILRPGQGQRTGTYHHIPGAPRSWPGLFSSLDCFLLFEDFAVSLV